MKLAEFRPGDLVSFQTPLNGWRDGVVTNVHHNKNGCEVFAESEDKSAWRWVCKDEDIGVLIKRRFLYAIGEWVLVSTLGTWLRTKVVAHPDHGAGVTVDSPFGDGPIEYTYENISKIAQPAPVEDVTKLRAELEYTKQTLSDVKTYGDKIEKARDAARAKAASYDTDRVTERDRADRLLKELAEQVTRTDAAKKDHVTAKNEVANLMFYRDTVLKINDALARAGVRGLMSHVDVIEQILNDRDQARVERDETKAEAKQLLHDLTSTSTDLRTVHTILGKVNAAINRAHIFCALDFDEAIDLIAKERDQACADRDRLKQDLDVVFANNGESLRNQTLTTMVNDLKSRMGLVSDAIRKAGITWQLDADKAVGVIAMSRDDAQKRRDTALEEIKDLTSTLDTVRGRMIAANGLATKFEKERDEAKAEVARLKTYPSTITELTKRVNTLENDWLTERDRADKGLAEAKRLQNRLTEIMDDNAHAYQRIAAIREALS